MPANPIDEAVVQLRRLADVIRKHGTVPSLSLEHIANTLTAAQQQGQVCECPIPMDDPPDMHAPGCVVRQPKQQGQAVAWLAADGSGRVIDHKAKAAGGRALATGSATSIYSIPLYTAPPIAPVGVGAKHIEALRSLRNVGVLYVEEREAIDAIIAALTQQPDPNPCTTLRFGLGEVIVNTGTSDGETAVFVDAAPRRGAVGSKAPDVPAGTAPLLRMLFPTVEQARSVCDALVNVKPEARGVVDEAMVRRALNAEYEGHGSVRDALSFGTDWAEEMMEAALTDALTETRNAR